MDGVCVYQYQCCYDGKSRAGYSLIFHTCARPSLILILEFTHRVGH